MDCLAKSIRLFALLSLLLGGFVSTAAAQDRRGLWFAFGSGAGSVGLSANDGNGGPLQSHREGGWVTVDLEGGWALNRQLLVGVELKAAAWNLALGPHVSTIDFDSVRGAQHVAAVFLYYPRSPSSRLFVKGGVGASSGYLASSPDSDVSSSGLGWTLGAGYDLHLWRHLSSTPTVNYWFGSPGDVHLNAQTKVSGWKYNVVDMTVVLKFD